MRERHVKTKNQFNIIQNLGQNSAWFCLAINLIDLWNNFDKSNNSFNISKECGLRICNCQGHISQVSTIIMSGWLTDKTRQWSDLGPKKVGSENVEDNIDDREDEGDDVDDLDRDAAWGGFLSLDRRYPVHLIWGFQLLGFSLGHRPIFVCFCQFLLQPLLLSSMASSSASLPTSASKYINLFIPFHFLLSIHFHSLGSHIFSDLSPFIDYPCDWLINLLTCFWWIWLMWSRLMGMVTQH